MGVYNVTNSVKQTCTAGVAKTVLQLQAPATRHLFLSAFSIGGFSIDPNHQTGEIRVTVSDSAGTSSTLLTPVPVDLRETTALHAAREGFTVEPSTNVKIVGGSYPLSPVSTLFMLQFAPDEVIVCPAGKFLNITCTFPGANQDVQASATVKE